MPLDSFHYSTNDLPAEIATESWRELMAPMYEVDARHGSGAEPRGTMTAYLLSDIIGNHTLFSPQHVKRDKRRINTTPDHLIFQLWRTGGCRGEVSGKSVGFGGGRVLLADRRREVDSRFTRSDTIGFIIPRSRLYGAHFEDPPLSFNRARNRLAAACLMTLHRRLPSLEPADIETTETDLLNCLHRLLDPSQAADVLEGAELDFGLMELARRAIDAELTSPDLSAESLASGLQVSRATLYRAFAPIGGIRSYISEQRLLAAHDALEDPIETRTIAQIAADFGFSSLSFFSRSFNKRFGLSPSACRAEAAHRAATTSSAAPETIKRWYNAIGR